MLSAGYSTGYITRFASKTYNGPLLFDQYLSRRVSKLSRHPAKSPTISKDDLNYYGDLPPAKASELAFSSAYFTQTAPRLLLTAGHFRLFPPSSVPEVAFLGRSNVGKSSLLNALLNRTNKTVAHTSSKPGRTRTMNAYGLGGVEEVVQKDRDAKAEKTMKSWKGARGIVVVDMPGYGKGSREEWGEEIVKYMAKREQCVSAQ
jgi:GTP-binding protein